MLLPETVILSVRILKESGWKLVSREHNIFQGQMIVQVYKDGNIRGSFNIEKDEEADDLERWIRLFGT